jgi:hypothetical protein
MSISTSDVFCLWNLLSQIHFATTPSLNEIVYSVVNGRIYRLLEKLQTNLWLPPGTQLDSAEDWKESQSENYFVYHAKIFYFVARNFSAAAL